MHQIFKIVLVLGAAASLSAFQTSSYDGNVHGLTLKKSLVAPHATYGVQVVNKSDGHPVRDGDSSIRFEVRAGDCGRTSDWDDCKNDRERAELSSTNLGGEQWVHWSIYLTENFQSIFPAKSALAQFHIRGSSMPVFMFQNSTGGYIVDNSMTNDGETLEQRKLFSDTEMNGKWNDILVHVKWSRNKEQGFFHVYVNGEDMPRYTWFGPTSRNHGIPYFKFGVYRTFMSRRSGPDPTPTQVAYYDNVVASRECATSTKYFDCTAINNNMDKVMAAYQDTEQMLKRAEESQGTILSGEKALADAACKDPVLSKMLPERCGK